MTLHTVGNEEMFALHECKWMHFAVEIFNINKVFAIKSQMFLAKSELLRQPSEMASWVVHKLASS